MSQHKYSLVKDGKQIDVLAGWDRPLQQVFLVVESLPVEPDGFEDLPQAGKEAFWERLDTEGEFLFNNLLTPVPSAEAVGEILKGLAIPVPEGFVEAIAADQAVNMGNKIVEYEVKA